MPDKKEPPRAATKQELEEFQLLHQQLTDELQEILFDIAEQHDVPVEQVTILGTYRRKDDPTALKALFVVTDFELDPSKLVYVRKLKKDPDIESKDDKTEQVDVPSVQHGLAQALEDLDKGMWIPLGVVYDRTYEVLSQEYIFRIHELKTRPEDVAQIH